ncbi:MAG: DUF4136 domain-containing protein [Pseudomonas sp.]|jgi:hypothetical protein|nr:DUF4136 domain-containing protein [Pseudomonas sp.]
MFSRYLLLISVLALSACQNHSIGELDYQTQHSFETLRSWQWAEPAIEFLPKSAEIRSDLDAERIRSAISEQLTQQGLQKAKNAPIQVRAWLITEQHQQRSQVMQNDYWGGMWGPSMRIENYDISYTTQKLQIDILDSTTQKLIWRASNSWALPASRTNPKARDIQLRKQVQRILQHFPPQ